MTQILTRNEKLIQILQAIAAIKATGQLPSEQAVAKAQSKKINRERCEKFSDYMTTRFLDACDSGDISSQLQNWKDKSNAEKLKTASDIVRMFLQNISADIKKNQVPMYQHDGSEYKNTNDEFDDKFIEKVSQMPDISVQEIEEPKNDDAMFVSSAKELRINMKNPAYKDNPAQFLADLRHELTHVIDIFVPSISPLDPSVREEAIRDYVGPHENIQAYKNNALELNANMKRDEYKKRISAMLALQETNRNRAMNMNAFGMRLRGYSRAA